MTQRRRERRAVDGIVLLDKPQGISSNAALQRVKRVYNAEKAGHTGSLDPLATGLLPICLGQATKLGGFLLDGDKHYRATLRLGARTTTGDVEGEIVATSDPRGIGPDAIEAARAALIGSIRQVPPMHSAIKIGGEKLYTLARQGIDIERAPREVTIHTLDLIARRGDELDFEVRCSKGTYVRTLAEDWAAAFGQCGHLSALRRIGAAPFTVDGLVGLDRLEAAMHDAAALESHLLPVAAALSGWPRCEVDRSQVRRLRNGHPVPMLRPAEGDCAVFDDGGELLCLGRADDHGSVQPRRWLGREPELGEARML